MTTFVQQFPADTTTDRPVRAAQRSARVATRRRRLIDRIIAELNRAA